MKLEIPCRKVLDGLVGLWCVNHAQPFEDCQASRLAAAQVRLGELEQLEHRVKLEAERAGDTYTGALLRCLLNGTPTFFPKLNGKPKTEGKRL